MGFLECDKGGLMIVKLPTHLECDKGGLMIVKSPTHLECDKGGLIPDEVKLTIKNALHTQH
jgi:hypothetical protein